MLAWRTVVYFAAIFGLLDAIVFTRVFAFTPTDVAPMLPSLSRKRGASARAPARALWSKTRNWRTAAH